MIEQKTDFGKFLTSVDFNVPYFDINNQIYGFFDPIADLKQFFSNMLSGIVNKIKSVLSPLFDAVKNAVLGVVNTIKSSVEWVKNTVGNIWNKLKGLASEIYNKLKSAFDDVKSFFRNLITSVHDAINKVGTFMKDKLLDVYNFIKSIPSHISDIYNKIKSYISNIVNSVKSALEKSIDFVKTKLESATHLLYDLGQNIIKLPETIWKGLEKIGSAIAKFFREHLESLAFWFSHKIDDLASRIISSLFGHHSPSVIDKIYDAIKWVVDKFKGFFGMYHNAVIKPIIAGGVVSPSEAKDMADKVIWKALETSLLVNAFSSAVSVKVAGSGVDGKPLSDAIISILNPRALSNAWIGTLAEVSLERPLRYYYNWKFRTQIPYPKDAFLMWHRGYIPGELYVNTLKWHGYSDAWAKALTRLYEYYPSPYELVWMSRYVYLDPAWLDFCLEGWGFVKEFKAPYMVFYQRAGLKSYIDTCVREAKELYESGLISFEELQKKLTSFKFEFKYHIYDPETGQKSEESSTFVPFSDTELKALKWAFDFSVLNKIRGLTLTAYRNRFTNLLMDEDQFKTKMKELGIPEDVQKAILLYDKSQVEATISRYFGFIQIKQNIIERAKTQFLNDQLSEEDFIKIVSSVTGSKEYATTLLEYLKAKKFYKPSFASSLLWKWLDLAIDGYIDLDTLQQKLAQLNLSKEEINTLLDYVMHARNEVVKPTLEKAYWYKLKNYKITPEEFKSLLSQLYTYEDLVEAKFEYYMGLYKPPKESSQGGGS